MSIEAPTKRIKKKTVTLQDVAVRAGTAKSTASMALNGKGWVSPETRELVLRVAREMNFEIDPSAKRLSMGRDFGTIVLLSQHLDIGVGSEKVQKIQRLLNERGYNAPIQGYGSNVEQPIESQSKIIQDLCRQRPQAIICNINEKNIHLQARQQLQTYQEEGGYVLRYDWPLSIEYDSVIFDREHNTFQAARYLLELGHRKLGLFDPSIHEDSPRMRGFKRALGTYGVDVERGWIYGFGVYSDFEARGHYLAEQILLLPKAKRPTALCIVNDLTALVFISVLRGHGLQVPQDISVVGHDGLLVAKYGAVPLTTVTHPVTAIAEQVVDLVDQRFSNTHALDNKGHRQIVVQGELVVRRSTAPLQ